MKFLLPYENHIMVDLETLSLQKNALILSIGAVRFNSEGLYDTFYKVVDMESCVEHGMHIDEKTVKWWEKQNPEAKKEFENRKGMHIRNALIEFRSYVFDVPSHIENMPYYIWGNGAAFDNAILETAFDLTRVEPLDFKSHCCFRTMNTFFRKNIPDIERSGVYHNAKDDAVYQAKKLMLINNNM